jgi:hypothetical protein
VLYFSLSFSPLLDFWLSFDIHLINLDLVIFCYACLHKELASDLLTLIFSGTIYRTTTVPSRTFYVVCQGSLLEFFINNCPLFTFPSPSWSPMISMGSVLHFTFERDDCVI